MTDHDLLRRFVNTGDDAAFEALVLRHGKMVHAVGRRMLRDPDSADDVLQATFLVLAQKGAQLAARTHGGASLGAWLYRVACNKSLALRRANVARQRRETGFAQTRSVATRDGGVFDRILPFLDEEIDALPIRYRMPVILCHLQGQTQVETAESLGITFATVRRRLDRARQLLRSRLIKRGFACSLSLLVPLFGRAANAAGSLRSSSLESIIEAAASVRQVTQATTVAASQSSGVFASMHNWGGSLSPVSISCAAATLTTAIGLLFAMPLFWEPHSADADLADLRPRMVVQTTADGASPESWRTQQDTNASIEKPTAQHDGREQLPIVDSEPVESFAEESQFYERLRNGERSPERPANETNIDDAAEPNHRGDPKQQQVAKDDPSNVQPFRSEIDGFRSDQPIDALAGARQMLEQMRKELKTLPQLEARRRRTEQRQTNRQPLVGEAKDLPELIRQNNIDWHTTAKGAYQVAEADVKPVMWFRVLGDLEGFM